MGLFPHELLARCTSRQLQELIEFEKLEPWGDEWRQSAQQTAAVWNAQLKPEERIPVEKFMPLPPPDPDEEAEEQGDDEEQTVDEIAAAFMSAGLQVVIDNGNSKP